MKRHFYQEEIFYLNDDNTLSDENQEEIVNMLCRNAAVGVVGGFFEEGFPVYFISHFALNSMGMSFDEFVSRTEGKYLNAIHPDDREMYAKSHEKMDVLSNIEYRLLDRNGEEVWVKESSAVSAAGDGQKIWISSIHKMEERQLISQAFRLLNDAYFRISYINLKKNFIQDMKLMDSELEELRPLNGDYWKSIVSCAQNHVKEKYREKFLHMMDPENLIEIFLARRETLSFSYSRLVEGEYKWVLSELVPVEDFSADNPCFMWYVKNISEQKAREAAMMDKILHTNAELRRTKQELENANKIISASNADLRKTLGEEEQYRQAIISGAIFVFNVNVSKNLIEEEFYEIVDDMRMAALPMVGLTVPCSADEFFKRWGETKVSPDDKELFLSTINTKHLLEAYNRGENELIVEYETTIGRGIPLVLRHTILLTRDTVSGEILALNNAKDVTELRKKDRDTRKALMDAYEAANRASSAKTDFLSRMSHDIRTPMNAIIGMTAIAGTCLDNPSRVSECLDKISTASRHLLALVNEVLDMSKIESGKFSLSEEEFNLSELVDTLINMVKPSVEEHRHRLMVHIHDIRHENVTGDNLKIRQAFVNIVENAVKYTPDGGQIDIDITEKPSGQVRTGCYEFIFRDNGIGMSPKFLTKIFEPFERAEDVRISKIPGSGLGLAITKNVIQMMGGDIRVESEIGVGTTFTVTVLLKYRDDDDSIQKEFKGLSVLVVDDDQIAGQSVCSLLSELGIWGDWVRTGEEAVRRAEASLEKGEKYFAIILNREMPEMDCAETARALRRVVGLEPIIILLAYSWSDIEMEARSAGVDVFITKPLFKSKLIRTLKSFLPDEESAAQPALLTELGNADYKDKRILLVEDNELNREIATEILEMAGLEVDFAENGKEAVDKITASEPGYYDLIFMDVQMPVMNGYDAARAIRALERRDTKHIPIVAMTANAFAEDIKAARDAGMNEHIAKPLDLKILYKTLEKWLR